MANSFASLKKSRKTDLEKLQSEVDKINNPKTNFSRDDDRFWKAELDKSGNGYAVIRFLPATNGEDMPYVRVFNHGFQGPGGWYIENSLTTLGQKDPLGEYNTVLWNSGIEANKEIARKQKRRLTYFSNVYVVEDKANPQNEGKVFLFRYGKKIFDKVSSMANPEFEDETPVDVFSFWEGANFKLKIRKVDGYWNYDKSEFEGPSPLFDNDDEIEEVWKNQYALKEFTDTTNFKSYDELKTRLNMVLAGTTTVGNVTTHMEDEPVEDVVVDTKVAVAPKVSVTVDDDSEEETLDYFQKLADG